MPDDPLRIDDIKRAAELVVRLYGDQALEKLANAKKDTVIPEFQAAVANEVRRILQSKK